MMETLHFAKLWDGDMISSIKFVRMTKSGLSAFAPVSWRIFRWAALISLSDLFIRRPCNWCMRIMAYRPASTCLHCSCLHCSITFFHDIIAIPMHPGNRSCINQPFNINHRETKQRVDDSRHAKQKITRTRWIINYSSHTKIKLQCTDSWAKPSSRQKTFSNEDHYYTCHVIITILSTPVLPLIRNYLNSRWAPRLTFSSTLIR